MWNSISRFVTKLMLFVLTIVGALSLWALDSANMSLDGKHLWEYVVNDN